MPRPFIVLAWAWVIVVGGIIITPGGVGCTHCGGRALELTVGILTAAVGVVGLVSTLRTGSKPALG